MSPRRPRDPDELTWEEREAAFRRQRVIDLAATCTILQIAARLRMDDGQVHRILRQEGIAAKPEPPRLDAKRLKGLKT